MKIVILLGLTLNMTMAFATELTRTEVCEAALNMCLVRSTPCDREVSDDPSDTPTMCVSEEAKVCTKAYTICIRD